MLGFLGDLESLEEKLPLCWGNGPANLGVPVLELGFLWVIAEKGRAAWS